MVWWRKWASELVGDFGWLTVSLRDPEANWALRITMLAVVGPVVTISALIARYYMQP